MDLAMLLLALAGFALSLGSSGHQMVLGRLNGDTKNAVNKLVSTINRELSSKRLSLNKIISLLSSKQNSALSGYLMNNPLVSKTMSEIESDATKLNQISADQATLESEIAQLTSELSSLGYTSSHKAAFAEQESRKKAEEALEHKKYQYEKLAKQAQSLDIGSTRSQVVNTSDLDALSQNIKGGLLKP